MLLAYREAVLTAFHDVDNALIAYASDQRRAADVTAQLAGARRNKDLADATVTVSTDLVALFKALGGGWDSP